MKLKYVVLITLCISSISLLVSILVLLNFSGNDLIPGVKEVKIFSEKINDVEFENVEYRFRLFYFEPYDESFVLSVSCGSTGIERVMSLGDSKIFFDLNVTVKESLYDSVILWIKKKGD